eukprot:1723737-Rhodomonas_salina.4
MHDVSTRYGAEGSTTKQYVTSGHGVGGGSIPQLSTRTPHSTCVGTAMSVPHIAYSGSTARRIAQHKLPQYRTPHSEYVSSTARIGRCASTGHVIASLQDDGT